MIRDTPGFTPTVGHEQKETAGFTPDEVAKQEKTTAKKAKLQQQEEKKEKAKAAANPAPEAKAERKLLSPEERAAKLKQAQVERRAKLKQQKEEDAVEEAPEEELDLDVLAYQISIEDVEQYLGITVLPDDKTKLQRRWAQKLRDPFMRSLLESKQAMKHPYALIPRGPRYIKGGQAVQTSFVNMVRSFPQLFDNVAQTINKYKAERFFVAEVPELDWAVVSCEAINESRNKNFMEQKTVIKQYVQAFKANDRRIQRRKLIEALYDIIIVNAVTKENILCKSVDLTSTTVGKQNFACINFGEKGIRINDVNRQQRHGQMGLCPSW